MNGDDELRVGRKNETANSIEQQIKLNFQNNLSCTRTVKSSSLQPFNSNINRTVNNNNNNNISSSEYHKINEHDMLQANRSDLKVTENYQNNYQKVVQYNSLQDRYHKLQSLSLQQILNRGEHKHENYHKLKTENPTQHNNARESIKLKQQQHLMTMT